MAESLPELGGEPRITVGDEVGGHTVQREDVLEKKVGGTSGIEVFGACEKANSFGKAIDEDRADSVAIVGLWKDCQIDAHRLPAIC